MGTTAPAGYLFCDGTVYNIADYPGLADHFETQFGTKNNFGGDGTTTFAVPDLRGEFLRGTGTNSHENNGSGSAVGVHQNGTQIPHAWGGSNNKYVLAAKTGATNTDGILSTGQIVASTGSLSTDSYSARYLVRPTNTSVLYCIKY